MQTSTTCLHLWVSNFGGGMRIGAWHGLIGPMAVPTQLGFGEEMWPSNSYRAWGLKVIASTMGTTPIFASCSLGNSCLALWIGFWGLLLSSWNSIDPCDASFPPFLFFLFFYFYFLFFWKSKCPISFFIPKKLIFILKVGIMIYFIFFFKKKDTKNKKNLKFTY